MARSTKQILARLDKLEYDAPPPGDWTPERWKRDVDAGRVATHPQQAARLIETYALLAEQIFDADTYT